MSDVACLLKQAKYGTAGSSVSHYASATTKLRGLDDSPVPSTIWVGED